MEKVTGLVWSRTTKSWIFGALIGFSCGSYYGVNAEAHRVYKDCRYSGVTRMGETAFKCEQFSKVVLLTPDEQYEKAIKQDKEKKK